jgi:hypothetical protein
LAALLEHLDAIILIGAQAVYLQSAEVARSGLAQLRRYFGAPRAAGVEMAIRALDGVKTADAIRELAPAFVAQLPTP